MFATESLFAHWYFHVPNFVLAALIYTLLGRFLLSLVFDRESDRVVWRAFRGITDPILAAVGAITPRLVPEGIVVLFAVVWLFALRIVLLLGVLAAGVRPLSGS